ncbi:MAG: hypothetical protein WA765_15825 [Candidatus Acidiferrum sp.]
MQIAVIGWGSLTWCPGCLGLKSRWHSDGPALPIELARISGDKRLTLVIHPGSPEESTPDQQTYWAMSEFGDLKAARKNLQAREGTASKHIHSLTADGQQEGAVDPEISARMGEWLKAHRGLEAAVWTGLPSNWDDEQKGRKFTVEDAVQYLGELEGAKDEAKATYDRAREYLINTPSQIQTPVRRIMREKKGWKDSTLSGILFETGRDDGLI